MKSQSKSNGKRHDYRLSPVRIYVLWHPKFEVGLTLARRIYHWFRLENMEGIPVYFRCSNGSGGDEPPQIPEDCYLNFIVPLVDAHMVASPLWRSYVEQYVEIEGEKKVCKNRLLPVAVDTVAYNMPASLRKINFIRHNLACDAPPSAEVLIGRLMEVMCRELRSHLADERRRFVKAGRDREDESAVPAKLRIFLSHAKADDTKEAVVIKEFLQSETQCEAFFDETDIASGYDYEQVLKKAIDEDSAGLIVIQGDHYADRPWCRREIRDFLKPVEVKGASDTFFIPPVVVVQTMLGKKMARTIPELGHAPCVRWNDDSARFIVITLLREILLGQFYRLLACEFYRTHRQPGFAFINRSPDPVMVERVLGMSDPATRRGTVVHPGYGLSSMERDGLRDAFGEDLTFTSFSELSSSFTKSLEADDSEHLAGAALCISASASRDILEAGAGDEHNLELLQRLLRPLIRKDVSLLYGGEFPEELRPIDPWTRPVNFTGAFLDMLISERTSSRRESCARLFNASFWPKSDGITPRVIAQWTDVCSFLPIGLSEIGVSLAPEKPERKAESHLSAGQRVKADQAFKRREKDYQAKLELLTARCLTEMRKRIACTMEWTPFESTRGKRPETKQFSTLAHIVIGGKIDAFLGIIPGVFEEVLHAMDAGKPLFILGSGRGAAGLLARWLRHGVKQRPRELRPEYYSGVAGFEVRRKLLEQALPMAGLETPKSALDRLWKHIRSASKPKGLEKLLNNKLDDAQNRKLLEDDLHYGEVCRLVWLGLVGLAKPGKQSASGKPRGQAPAVKRPARRSPAH